jgi:hypothetical protein
MTIQGGNLAFGSKLRNSGSTKQKACCSCEQVETNHKTQTWKPKLKQEGTRKLPKKPTSYQEEEQEEDEHYLGRFPLRTKVQLQNRTSPDQTPNTPEPDKQPADTSISENTDPNYEPHQTPISRRELLHTCAEPPVTRSRARNISQELWYSLIHTKI